jgi:hypothetical protein
MKILQPIFFFGILSTVLAWMPVSAEVDCVKLSLAVKRGVAAEPSRVLEIVAVEISTAPACACEIVKAAIEGSQAKPEAVAAIVQAAITAAPEQMRLISQCAVAVAPDALPQVQAVLAKLDPKHGDAAVSAKSAKDAKAPVGETAAMPNPLDFPGQGPLGPILGGPGGQPLIPIYPPIIIIIPPETSPVDIQ